VKTQWRCDVLHTNMATNQKFHRQPFATVRKPPMIYVTKSVYMFRTFVTSALRTGPIVGPIHHTAIAVPRYSRGIRSAIVPPPSTRGAPPNAVVVSMSQTGCRVYIRTTHEEPKHDELAHACGNCSGNGEDDEEQVAGMIQR
jgi:hypothetical protein